MPAPTVLVVDDEEAVRRFVCRVLERDGYRALAASGPDEALDAVRRPDAPIDLVLTDVQMPRMAGHELVPRLLARRPSLRVLYMSGYAGDAPPALAPLLEKPFTAAALVAAVRGALAEPQAA